MKKSLLLLLLSFSCVNCSTLSGLFSRRSGPKIEPTVETPPPAQAEKRTTRKSIEEESMLGEGTGSLWSGRGQASYLFVNNNQRLLGDLLNVNVDGYPKEQIQMKVNTIAKLLAQILNDQKQEIKLKEEEIQKKNAPPPVPAPAAPAAPGAPADVKQRGLASVASTAAKAPEAPPAMSPENEKQLRKIEEESQEIADMSKAKEFPIRSVPTRVMDVQKDGTYRVAGERAFMIGKREYKLKIAGYVKAEDFDDKGISAEVLMEPTFDITSDKKVEDL
jgi:flagellar basal body L-ring protein FlgH